MNMIGHGAQVEDLEMALPGPACRPGSRPATRAAINGSKKGSRLRVQFSLRTAMLSSIFVVVLTVCTVSILPLSVGWFTTLDSLNHVSSRSLTTEFNALRKSVVQQATAGVTSTMHAPVLAVLQLQLSTPMSLLEEPVLIHDNHATLHQLYKPLFDVNTNFSNIVC
eukprot:TRINITY_DN7385_c0_g1_i2.p1 TRINITY_DN7385_c0_g1~~TRINITY_DN7385_c0_g1_i2.p1  ORF type:complete len:166 (+),score=48.54 TRINITY_DN7385_c0_g1_i2:66-563(+)